MEQEQHQEEDDQRDSFQDADDEATAALLASFDEFHNPLSDAALKALVPSSPSTFFYTDHVGMPSSTMATTAAADATTNRTSIQHRSDGLNDPLGDFDHLPEQLSLSSTQHQPLLTHDNLGNGMQNFLHSHAAADGALLQPSPVESNESIRGPLLMRPIPRALPRSPSLSSHAPDADAERRQQPPPAQVP